MKEWNDGKGHRYVGEWSSDGVMHGTGTYYWDNDATLTGEWHRGTPNGYGVLHTHNGARSYFGQWANGRKNGAGACCYRKQDAYYRGAFKDDVRNGYGEFTDGDVTTCGMWSSDVRRVDRDAVVCDASGFPCAYYVLPAGTPISASAYEKRRLEMRPDDDDGRAHDVFVPTKVDLPSGATYHGEIRGVTTSTLIVAHGSGAWTHADGSYYEGQLSNGAFHGIGVYGYDSGAVYLGSFRHGKKHGLGCYVFPNADLYIGEYEEDRKHGRNGVYFHAETLRHTMWTFRDGKKEAQTACGADDIVKRYAAARDMQTELAPFLRFSSPSANVLSALLLTSPILYSGGEAQRLCIPRHVCAISRGCLHNLVAYLVNTTLLDTDFVDTFLTTFHCFASHDDVLLNIAMHKNKLRTWHILRQWGRTYDGIRQRFGGGQGQALLTSLIAEVSADAPWASIAGGLETAPPPPPKHPSLTEGDDVEFTPGMDLTATWSPVVVATAVTLVERHAMRQITPFEFLAYTSQTPLSQAEGGGSTITSATERFNMSARKMVRGVLEGATVSDRARLVTYWCAVTRHLIQMRNFQWVFLVTSVLTSHYVERLKGTWALVDASDRAQTKTYEELLSPIGNFRLARERQKRGPSPTVPYLGISLKDLAQTHEGNPTLLPCRSVNWRKMMLLRKVIREFTTQLVGEDESTTEETDHELSMCVAYLQKYCWGGGERGAAASSSARSNNEEEDALYLLSKERAAEEKQEQ